jgi:pimeloyl-ACP methyl ester carboxylesterase
MSVSGKTITGVLAAAWVLLICGYNVLSQEVPLRSLYPDHSRLLIYMETDGSEHPVKTAADWARRRQHILDGMQEAMGTLPSRENLPPFDAKTLESVVTDDVERRKISIVIEEGDRLNVYLLAPTGLKKEQKAPAMLALHPTNPLGKMPTAGVNERTKAYGLELAKRGYVVLVPDYPSMGDEKDYDFENDRYVSGTMKGIFNHMRCVDYLCSLDRVDPQRIGVIGHSLGGHNAMFAAVFDRRLKVIVSSCGWTPFRDYYGGDIAGWTSDRYMPRLRDVYNLDPDVVPFDFYEVVAALAPRPFFSSSPLHDENFDVNGVKKAIPAAEEIYRLLEASDRLQVRSPDVGHAFPAEVREEAYRFIDKALDHTPGHRGGE